MNSSSTCSNKTLHFDQAPTTGQSRDKPALRRRATRPLRVAMLVLSASMLPQVAPYCHTSPNVASRFMLIHVGSRGASLRRRPRVLAPCLQAVSQAQVPRGRPARALPCAGTLDGGPELLGPGAPGREVLHRREAGGMMPGPPSFESPKIPRAGNIRLLSGLASRQDALGCLRKQRRLREQRV